MDSWGNRTSRNSSGYDGAFVIATVHGSMVLVTLVAARSLRADTHAGDY